MKLISTIFALLFSTLAFSTSVNKIIVFGDSLSDNGNLYEYMKHQLPQSPPYHEGRFTNGPVWIELIASTYYPGQEKARLQDYAFGGAGILKEGEDDEGLFTLNSEIATYLLSKKGKADPNGLYVVWIGSNNYLAMSDDVEDTLNTVLNGIEKGLQTLIEAGARNIVVVNSPELGKTPAAREFGVEGLLTDYSRLHNERLNNLLVKMHAKYPQVKWVPINVHEMMNDIFINPAKFGFTNIYGTCYDTPTTDQQTHFSVLKMVSQIQARNQALSSNDPCEGYLFFDLVHPAALAHKILAERAKIKLREEGIKFI